MRILPGIVLVAKENLKAGPPWINEQFNYPRKIHCCLVRWCQDDAAEFIKELKFERHLHSSKQQVLHLLLFFFEQYLKSLMAHPENTFPLWWYDGERDKMISLQESTSVDKAHYGWNQGHALVYSFTQQKVQIKVWPLAHVLRVSICTPFESEMPII